jgi:hypothetical protein
MSQGTEAEVLPHLAVAWRAAPKTDKRIYTYCFAFQSE